MAGNAWYVWPRQSLSALIRHFHRAILHDKDEYPEPFEFRPERFLKDGQLNPDVRDPAAAFGFGRRHVPAGSHVLYI